MDASEKRVATHSHIRGLGLDAAGRASHATTEHAGGFVGQAKAREAAGLVVDMVRARRMAGRAVLLVGAPGTGKTALALALAQELGPRVPFVPMVGSEVFSAEVRKTAVLAEAFRRAVGVRIRETKEVWEGEVVSIAPVETATASATSSGPAGVALTLRTAKGSRDLRLDAASWHALVRARVRPGDVVYIEAAGGAVRRVGRADTLRGETDLDADEYVPIPRGDVHRHREVVQDATLADIDAANARPAAPGASGAPSDVLASLTAQIVRGTRGRTEVTERLRAEVDRIVERMVRAGAAEVTPGVLFIDEAHMLDAECFAYLNRAVEAPNAPLLVLATNRGALPGRGVLAPVRGAADSPPSPHGIPRELLDRMLVVRTAAYAPAEMEHIVAVRARAEGLVLADGAAAALAAVGAQCSLRYALQLLAPAAVLGAARGAALAEVAAIDVREAAALFLDARRASVPASS